MLNKFSTTLLLCCLCLPPPSSPSIRTLRLQQIPDIRGKVWKDSVVSSSYARSLLECSRACAGNAVGRAMIYWPQSEEAERRCVCYSAGILGASSSFEAPGARCYMLQGEEEDIVTLRCKPNTQKVGGQTGIRKCGNGGTWILNGHDPAPVCTKCGSCSIDD
ncbi:hypothetical protein ACOMHN_056453 [Nucella lapillus]